MEGFDSVREKAMSELTLPAIKTKRLKRPPRRLVYKAVEVLCEAAWIMTTLIITLRQSPIDLIWMAIWTRWFVRDYRELRKLVSDWLNDRKIAETGFGERISMTVILLMTTTMVPLSLVTLK